MGRKILEKTVVKSIRVKKNMKLFLEELDNANDFIIQLIVRTEEYQTFLARFDEEKNKNQSKLF